MNKPSADEQRKKDNEFISGIVEIMIRKPKDGETAEDTICPRCGRELHLSVDIEWFCVCGYKEESNETQ